MYQTLDVPPLRLTGSSSAAVLGAGLDLINSYLCWHSEALWSFVDLSNTNKKLDTSV